MAKGTLEIENHGDYFVLVFQLRGTEARWLLSDDNNAPYKFASLKSAKARVNAMEQCGWTVREFNMPGYANDTAVYYIEF